MGKLIASINVSVDGFCNHNHVIADNEMHAFINHLMQRVECVLFGRKTFELFESYWPELAKTRQGDPEAVRFAELIGQTNKLVFSRFRNSSDWQKTQFESEIDLKRLETLKQQTDKDILILGSPSIFNALTKMKLIDEYNLLTQPIFSGTGVRLFENSELTEKISLKLTCSKVHHSGILNQFYVPSSLA